MAAERRRTGARLNAGAVVLGVALIGVGVAALLDRADIVGSGEVIGGWWPVLVVVAGLAQMAGPRQTTNGLITVAIGAVLLGWTTGFLTGGLVALAWPLLLVVIGVWILLTRGGAAAAASGDPSEELRAGALFSGRKIVSHGRPFRRGVFSAAFGGVEVDLCDAVLPPEGADIDVTAAFGGVDITVPPGWRIDMSGPALFGAYEDSTTGPADGPVLRVRCLVLFGGAEVKQGRAPAPPVSTPLPGTPPAPA